MTATRNFIVFAASVLLCILSFTAILCVGAVEIPFREVWAILFGAEGSEPFYKVILLESRLPMAVTALLAGLGLSPAGLILQTTFRNPLAGPSILGVSSGASLGVAMLLLLCSGMPLYLGWGGFSMLLIAALIGAAVVIFFLSSVSTVVKSPYMLLIVGVLIGYLTSSLISLLSFLAPAESVKTFMVWGLGSFSGVTNAQLPFFSISTILIALLALLWIKPLNALLLGERYATTMGYNVVRLRTSLLTVCGLLTAVVTAFCGPIAFVGIIVPHICRMASGTANHSTILPLSMVMGAGITSFCAFLSILPITTGVLPINTITPIIGIPIILYIIFRRK